MVISIYNYFLKVNFKTENYQKITLHKRISDILSISENTIRVIVTDWNKHDDNIFILHKTLSQLKLQFNEFLYTKILNANKTAEQLFTYILWQLLAEKKYDFSKWKLLQILYQLGFYYGQGECKNLLYKSLNNVTFRNYYFHFYFINLEGQNDVSHHLKVFFDKLYCHLHHKICNIWIPHHGVILIPGHSPLVVIFKAIIIFWNGSFNKLNGKLVSNFIIHN